MQKEISGDYIYRLSGKCRQVGHVLRNNLRWYPNNAYFLELLEGPLEVSLAVTRSCSFGGEVATRVAALNVEK
jgi:hypothetical protein